MDKLPPKLTIFIAHPSDFLTDCRPNGDGLTAFGFIKGLAARGHTLHIAAQQVELEGALPPNVKIYPIKTYARGLITQRLEYMLRSRLLFNRLRRQHRFDLIHQLNPVNKGLSLGLLGVGLPIVLGQFYPDWPADAEAPPERPALWRQAQLKLKAVVRRQVLRWQQRFAAALLLSSPAARGVLYKPERVEEKIFVVPSGVDVEHFTPAPAGQPSATPPHILFLASLWRRKGILTMLEAFALIHRAMPECRLTIVGSGTLEEEVHARAEAMAARAQITFIKQVSRAEMPVVARQCTVYCLPSYGEPLGQSALEVMACGKPIVGTDAGGLAHTIREAGGRKVPPRDAQALAAALLEILASSELQTQMGEFNRRLIVQDYAWDRVIDKLESIYQTVLHAAPAPAMAQPKVPSMTNYLLALHSILEISLPRL